MAKRLQEYLRVEGISLSRSNSQALLADEVGPEPLMQRQLEAMDKEGLTVVRQGMSVAGVSIGTEQVK